jgi:hypothetical protein
MGERQTTAFDIIDSRRSIATPLGSCRLQLGDVDSLLWLYNIRSVNATSLQRKCNELATTLFMNKVNYCQGEEND